MKFKAFFTLIIFFITTCVYSQQNPEIQQIKSELLGEWVRSDNNSYKLVFYVNGEQKYYKNGTLIWSHYYDVNTECFPGVCIDDNRFVLKTLDQNGNELNCDVINAVNKNNSGILSITTAGQGKLIIYERP